MAKSPFGFDRPNDSPGFLLWQTTMIWQRLIRTALEKHDISHAQFVILATLLWFELHSYEPTQVSIADWSKLDKMTVSKSLKKLVLQGFVKRHEHQSDTRAKVVMLTDAGRRLAQQLIPLVEGIDADFFGAIPQVEQRTLIQILAKLTGGPNEPA